MLVSILFCFLNPSLEQTISNSAGHNTLSLTDVLVVKLNPNQRTNQTITDRATNNLNLKLILKTPLIARNDMLRSIFLFNISDGGGQEILNSGQSNPPGTLRFNHQY